MVIKKRLLSVIVLFVGGASIWIFQRVSHDLGVARMEEARKNPTDLHFSLDYSYGWLNGTRSVLIAKDVVYVRDRSGGGVGNHEKRRDDFEEYPLGPETWESILAEYDPAKLRSITYGNRCFTCSDGTDIAVSVVASGTTLAKMDADGWRLLAEGDPDALANAERLVGKIRKIDEAIQGAGIFR